MTEIEELKSLLSDNDYTCVIKKSDNIITSTERGIQPVITILKDNINALIGAIVCDKVIGRAAALLFVYGGISAVHTMVISKTALEVFEKNNISVTYDKLVNRIQNRTKTGLCPMETLAMDITSPEDAYDFFSKIELKGQEFV